jgi:beta-N-acetylhexosaminidase
MDMGAIVDNFTEPRSAVMAIQAGADLIAAGPSLSMNDQLAMKQAIINAVGSGAISAAQIEASARRVLRLKAKYGLLDWSPLDPAAAAQRVNMAAHQTMLESIYLDTVAISYDFVGFLPLKPGEKKVAVVFPGVYPGVERACSAISPGNMALAYSLNPTDAEMISVRQMAREADVVVLFTYNIDEYPRQAQLVNNVPSEKSVVIALQSPYDFEWGIQPGAYIVAFNPYPPAFRAACAVLYGQHKAVGSFQVISG